MSSKSTDDLLQRAAADIRDGRVAQAEWSLRKLLTRDPKHAPALDLLAAMELHQGRATQAIALLRLAVVIQPTSADLHYNLAVALVASGQNDPAIESYERAITLKPDFVSAYNNLGNCLRSQGRLLDAAEKFSHALRLRPDYALGHNNLALVLLDSADIDQALPHLRTAISLKPDFAMAHSNLCLATNSHEGFTRQQLFAEHQEFARLHAPPVPRMQPHARAPRLRIGYLSPDFRSHSVAFFIDKVLANHDRARFDVTCYASVARPDAVTQRIKSHVEHWRDIHNVADDSAADMIRADKIDILIDLAGHTEANRLLLMTRRPAPIQATYLGYPNTTGLSQIDYLITDHHIAPQGADAFYSEKLIRLPRTFFCYVGPDLGVPITPPPVLSNGRITFGVFTNLVKVRPPMIALWSRILHAVPNSRLIIKAKSLNDPRIQSALRKTFESHNIPPGRLDFHGWTDFPDYQRLLGQIDIALDTYPFNGHTTTVHALWMGVPVVTLTGQTHASRMGKSVLSTLGLEDLAAQSPEDYLSIAAQLAANPDRLRSLRLTLRDRFETSGLLDGPRFTRELETAYLNIAQIDPVA